MSGEGDDKWQVAGEGIQLHPNLKQFYFTDIHITTLDLIYLPCFIDAPEHLTRILSINSIYVMAFS